MSSTLPAESGLREARRGRVLRRLFVVLLTVFLVAGAAGAYGVRSRTVEASDGAMSVTLTFATVTRPGLATPWSLEVTREGGFNGPIEVATTGKFFDLFDENGLDPDPVSAVGEGDEIVWEFDPPEGDTLQVSFDARVEPAAQMAWIDATTSVTHGDEEAEVPYRMWVLP